ncbi:MAG: hypothetical protein Q7T82_18270 [Armatimonadota bacterium]|nr:hypothetical protein [Armatimonadota bacterium]
MTCFVSLPIIPHLTHAIRIPALLNALPNTSAISSTSANMRDEAGLTRTWSGAHLRRRLTELHLLRSPELDTPAAKLEGQGDGRAGTGAEAGLRYERRERRVYINGAQVSTAGPLPLPSTRSTPPTLPLVTVQEW